MQYPFWEADVISVVDVAAWEYGIITHLWGKLF